MKFIVMILGILMGLVCVHASAQTVQYLGWTITAVDNADINGTDPAGDVIHTTSVSAIAAQDQQLWANYNAIKSECQERLVIQYRAAQGEDLQLNLAQTAVNQYISNQANGT